MTFQRQYLSSHQTVANDRRRLYRRWPNIGPIFGLCCCCCQNFPKSSLFKFRCYKRQTYVWYSAQDVKWLPILLGPSFQRPVIENPDIVKRVTPALNVGVTVLFYRKIKANRDINFCFSEILRRIPRGFFPFRNDVSVFATQNTCSPTSVLDRVVVDIK